jgi:AcrR family transcriptional regulator
MIALKLEMSSGNLNYHFKKREEILEALYFQMVKDFDERISKLSEIEISFGQIKNDIRSSMKRLFGLTCTTYSRTTTKYLLTSQR